MDMFSNKGLVELYYHITNPRRLCSVEGIGECIFHMLYAKSWTHGASITIGGFSAGQESIAMALVEDSAGVMHEVVATSVHFLDRKVDE